MWTAEYHVALWQILFLQFKLVAAVEKNCTRPNFKFGCDMCKNLATKCMGEGVKIAFYIIRKNIKLSDDLTTLSSLNTRSCVQQPTKKRLRKCIRGIIGDVCGMQGGASRPRRKSHDWRTKLTATWIACLYFINHSLRGYNKYRKGDERIMGHDHTAQDSTLSRYLIEAN